MGRVLVALGGNALIREGQTGTWAEQQENARSTARALMTIRAAGNDVIVSHGNGPQVGNLAIQSLLAVDEVPQLPLDALGAMTQGQLGYLISQALTEVAPDVPSVAVVTRVVVDPHDPAFGNPTKPIGPFYEEAEAHRLGRQNGWTVVSDAGRGWRRVVPSPPPVEVLELDAIRDLADGGRIVIAGGGGGVPVARIDGRLTGVEAVIDKDRLAGMLASALGCETLIMLTGTSRVSIDYGTRWQRDLARITVSAAERHLAEGEFPPGSMGPKIEAAIRAVTSGGRALITRPDRIAEALAGDDGTWIVPNDQAGSVPVSKALAA